MNYQNLLKPIKLNSVASNTFYSFSLKKKKSVEEFSAGYGYLKTHFTHLIGSHTAKPQIIEVLQFLLRFLKALITKYLFNIVWLCDCSHGSQKAGQNIQHMFVKTYKQYSSE